MSEEQMYMDQLEEAYQRYAAQVEAYNKLIATEEDPQRKAHLEAMLADLHEENK